MAEVQIRQVRSANGASPDQRAALRSLKLGRIGRASTFPDSPNLQGQIRAVQHLVEVGEAK
ncbi:MAG TPA: 50S ribosomal protein L30 [Solirubrobacterales bacterium]|jgi:large subunit ribosomal protein L30|nr:50S ribosomal protein L30 [Solirubrobacterales bacterium]